MSLEDKIIYLADAILKLNDTLKMVSSYNSIPMIQNSTKNNLIPLTKWNDYHEWPTLQGFRNIVFNKKTNGLDKFKVINKVGKRIFIDEANFFEWMKSNPKI